MVKAHEKVFKKRTENLLNIIKTWKVEKSSGQVRTTSRTSGQEDVLEYEDGLYSCKICRKTFKVRSGRRQLAASRRLAAVAPWFKKFSIYIDPQTPTGSFDKGTQTWCSGLVLEFRAGTMFQYSRCSGVLGWY